MMQALAFLTCHRKEQVVAPVLAQAGYAVSVVEGFNTDELGTFTSEKIRPHSQVDTAIAKARLACDLAGVRLGLGSEGAFGPHPEMPLVAYDLEVLALWDAQRGSAIVAQHGSVDTNFLTQEVSSRAEVQAFVERVQCPSHGLIVGRSHEPHFAKGLVDLEDIFRRTAQVIQTQGSVWLETDMRAHLNPSRMRVIGETAHQLLASLQRHCPRCDQPGFDKVASVHGAQCAQCGFPSKYPKSDIYRCQACGHEETRALHATISPADCLICNP
jgi:hypothetical protein